MTKTENGGSDKIIFDERMSGVEGINDKDGASKWRKEANRRLRPTMVGQKENQC